MRIREYFEEGARKKTHYSQDIYKYVAQFFYILELKKELMWSWFLTSHLVNSWAISWEKSQLATAAQSTICVRIILSTNTAIICHAAKTRYAKLHILNAHFYTKKPQETSTLSPSLNDWSVSGLNLFYLKLFCVFVPAGDSSTHHKPPWGCAVCPRHFLSGSSGSHGTWRNQRKVRPKGLDSFNTKPDCVHANVWKEKGGNIFSLLLQLKINPLIWVLICWNPMRQLEIKIIDLRIIKS